MIPRHLYVIQSATTGAIKIGRSNDPLKRLAQLQTGSPYRLRIILVVEGGGWREGEIHKKLSAWKTTHANGGEWFSEDAIGSIPDDVWELASEWYLNDPDWWKENNMAFRKTGQSVTAPVVVELVPPPDAPPSPPEVGQTDGDKVWDGQTWIPLATWYERQQHQPEQ